MDDLAAAAAAPKGNYSRPAIGQSSQCDQCNSLVVPNRIALACIPGEFGPWRTIATRFYQWQRDGTWHRVFCKSREIADAQGLLDWDTHCIDSTVIRAHQHAAGGKKGLLARLHAAEVTLERKCVCELMVAAIPSPLRSRAAKRTTRRNS